tara:strand:- start:138 stop:551 length:414 start_codon:yes stop_codon:yes gene_type:complete
MSNQHHQQQHQRTRPAYTSQEVRVVEHVPVHPDYVGVVIGKEGATVQKICRETNTAKSRRCNLNISHKAANFPLGHHADTFAVSGLAEDVGEASRWIRKILANTYLQKHPEERPQPRGGRQGQDEQTPNLDESTTQH